MERGLRTNGNSKPQTTHPRYGPRASPYGFEDLDVYKAAREFRRVIYRIAKGLPETERYGLSQQMRRAAVSVTSNIAEGHGRHHWQEGLQFCRHSRGSLMELIDAVNTCLDEGFGNADHLNAVRTQGGEVLRLLNGYIAYLEKQKSKDSNT